MTEKQDEARVIEVRKAERLANGREIEVRIFWLHSNNSNIEHLNRAEAENLRDLLTRYLNDHD